MEIATHSADEAVKAAERIGYPVVLKGVAAKLLHKSDVGAVVLHLANAEAVRALMSASRPTRGKPVLNSSTPCWSVNRSAADWS